MRPSPTLTLLASIFATLLHQAHASDPLPINPAMAARVDKTVNAVLARTAVPSASIALVRHSAIVYAKAYGWAEISPQRAATPSMRYAVGSVSKEFTATALLLLQEAGKVSIDDKAGKYLEGLGPAAETTLRALLSHTSGVRDFWPQDYDTPEMLAPVKPEQIAARWANQPLDFAPGSAWQYSNTGYTLAGMIVERAAAEPLFQFLEERIFVPLKMQSVVDFDARPLTPTDATGYMRYALGPPRPAAKEGRGWLFGAGELAMTASDLARWDIALIEHKILRPESYRSLTSEILLTDGVGTGYALGLGVDLESGKRRLRHGGEVGGFTAENRLYPDDGVAIVVFTNEDATDASRTIADELANVLLVADSPADAQAVVTAKDLFRQFQAGTADLTRFTANAKSYFTAQALEDFRASLGTLGAPREFKLTESGRRGGFITRSYDIEFAKQTLQLVVRSTTDGLIEQYTVASK